LAFYLTYALITSSNISHKITQLQVPGHFRSEDRLLWVKMWVVMLSRLSLASILPRQRKN